ncbi:U3 small nucleolar RNA-associated protein 18 homolog [Amphibalanus amphitrite]|nr:U3 small nucleolar RNA-associated protein 18 homolog [Amphibalanus amphitrite]XP_043191026.1 U3 small nucleolar RNA-associated protein 18 homolog [Amphibalanus amphitrite]
MSARESSPEAPAPVEIKAKKKKKLAKMETPIKADKDADEQKLESLVFGLETDLVSQLQRPASPVSEDLSETEADGLLCLDRRGHTASDDEDGEEEESEEKPMARQPAWVDDDDEQVTVAQVEATFAQDQRRAAVAPAGRYRAALEQRFTSVVGAPQWAQLDRKRRRDSDDEEDSELLTKTGRLLSTARSARLAKGTVLTKTCAPLTAAVQRRPRTVTALEFHPGSQVALVGGGGRPALALVQVDGVDNPLIQEVPLDGFRVQCAHFTRDGGQLMAGSEHAAHLLCYDMMAGRVLRVEAGRRLGLRGVPQFTMSPDGRWLAVPGARAGAVHLLSARTHEWVDTLQASGRVTALAFTPDGTRLFTHTDEGRVYEWDMSTRACCHRFDDEGCLSGTSLACAPNGRLLACGSSSGIVNVYEMATARRASHPRPVKVFDQLTTTCDQLRFNVTAELLVMASSQKEHAVKLVHVPSMTVFSNFPGWSTAVQEPHSLDLSLSSGYLTVGNNKGRALLYRLQHYDSY